MTICRAIALLALALLMAGCASSAQIAQHNNERCAARGFQPDTKEFTDCLVQLDNEHVQRMDARRQEWMLKSGSPLAR